jgi:hypothetical protein
MATILATLKTESDVVTVLVQHEPHADFPFAVYDRQGRRKFQRVNAFPTLAAALQYAGEHFARCADQPPSL